VGSSHLSGSSDGQLIATQKIEELRKDLGKKILEKEEALAQLQSLRPVRTHNIACSRWCNIHQDSFDTHEFLRGGLGEVPPKPNPVSMVHQERRRFVEVS